MRLLQFVLEHLNPLALFRSSRPDYIETAGRGHGIGLRSHCSGLPGRTTLRQPFRFISVISTLLLFRSSRPDYIETLGCIGGGLGGSYCSGLPGRTTLRLLLFEYLSAAGAHCSGLPGRTTLRLDDVWRHLYECPQDCSGLPGRTTLRLYDVDPASGQQRVIVPVFQAGLH